MYRLRVKEVIKAHSSSISQVSRGADVSINLVRRMANDPSYTPTYITLAKVARYLRVSMEELFYDDQNPKQDAATS